MIKQNKFQMERKEIEDRDLKAILTMLDFTEKEITREIFKEYVCELLGNKLPSFLFQPLLLS